MWVWDSKVYMSQDATRRLFEFCRSKSINRLYLSVLSFNDQNTQNYRVFNKLAHNQGIFVHALGGDPRWGLERYHQQPLRWVEDILSFNRAVRPHERFDGIENDTEVYLLGKPWEQNKEQILKEYLDLNRKIMDLIKIEESEIAYGCDIPFWYDDDPSMTVNWNGQSKPPSLHILDTVNTVNIMDYRNFAEGPNGSIALAKNEIEYAAAVGKKVFIGQETTENLYPEYITFAGMSESNMELQLGKLVEAYADLPSFGGIAIHHYGSYRKLVEKQ
ncbi:MAG: hypothetical protein NTV07_01745 [Candidatus Omnitrophica bacterium]|nr:hypothetical protein [Candidatus Omnitrophota bacterium]